MRGLLLKIWYETWLMTLLFGLGMLGFCALLTYVIPQFQGELFGMIERLPFLKPVFAAFLGTEVDAEINARTFQAFLWVHPTILALTWAHAIIFSSRMPAGEIDRATIDVLLGLPVSRRTIFAVEVVAWLGTGVFVFAMGFTGHCLTLDATPPESRPDSWRALTVMANLCCVYIAVGGVAFLISTLSNRRGRAMAVAFALVLASFLLNFLAQFWEPADQVAFLGVMNYYQPVEILNNGVFPTLDMIVLLSVGTTALLVGSEVFARRSVCTV